MSIAAKVGCTAQTLDEWVKTAEMSARNESSPDAFHMAQTIGAPPASPLAPI